MGLGVGVEAGFGVAMILGVDMGVCAGLGAGESVTCTPPSECIQFLSVSYADKAKIKQTIKSAIFSKSVKGRLMVDFCTIFGSGVTNRKMSGVKNQK